MQSCSHRSTLIISGLVTLLVLGGAGLALGFHNGWLRTASGAAAGSTQTATRDEAEVYRQKLDEAYRALDGAYAQIRALQAPQVTLASSADSDARRARHDGNDDRRERGSRRRDSDDH